MAYLQRDPVQRVVAQALEALAPNAGIDAGTAPIGALSKTQQIGIAPATVPSSFDLYAGQGKGGFGQGSFGSQPSDSRRTTTVF